MTSGTFGRWKTGLCPCCGADLDWYDDLCDKEAVAEGVVFCGRCIANDHHAEDILPLILMAIAKRDDSYLIT